MSTLAERIDLTFATLEEVVTKAESAKEETQAVREFAAKVNGLVKFVDNMNGSAAQVVEALGDKAEVWPQLISELREIGSEVSKASGLDRTSGDESVNALRMLAGAPLFAFDEDADAKAKADDLIARWAASAPKSTARGEGSGNPVPELGFTVKCSCQRDSCNWSASTTKDNRNSFWRQASLHMRDGHKIVASGAKDELGKGTIEAMTKVMSGEVQAAEGGSFIVVKA